ncbi:hypothetical protein QYE76_000916 [Lolium multiflorum]|uniref:Uncharacterized protein n=1 Tax=Lolium multiflorum TaxID=4521 RepID=A0AAD8RIH3_LOLMU|nr:hypothetical protein QYE76_000916 [Lolium multiflorum]
MAGMAAISSVFIGSVEVGTWASAALGGALAAAVSTWSRSLSFTARFRRTSRPTSLNRCPHRQEYVHLQAIG